MVVWVPVSCKVALGDHQRFGTSFASIFVMTACYVIGKVKVKISLLQAMGAHRVARG
jgi:hypothetical protein